MENEFRESDDIKRINHKLDSLADSMQSITNMLYEQKGANLPTRLESLEVRMNAAEVIQATRNTDFTNLKYIQDKHTVDIEANSKFNYKIAGALIVLNVIVMIFGKVLLDKFL